MEGVDIIASEPRYAMMEMGLDSPDLPMAMLSNLHLKRCKNPNSLFFPFVFLSLYLQYHLTSSGEEVLQNFIDAVKSVREDKGKKVKALWSDYSQRWFTLMHSTRPFIFRDHQDIADHVRKLSSTTKSLRYHGCLTSLLASFLDLQAAAALETIRDITVASHLVGNLTGSTIDDPLFDRYKKLGCSIFPLEKDTDDYRMIINYLEKTYEPIKVGEFVSSNLKSNPR